VERTNNELADSERSGSRRSLRTGATTSFLFLEVYFCAAIPLLKESPASACPDGISEPAPAYSLPGGERIWITRLQFRGWLADEVQQNLPTFCQDSGFDRPMNPRGFPIVED
jgi:hypothetical protein